MGTLPLPLLVGIEYFLCPNQFTKSVDVLRRFDSCREILETVCLVGVQRLVDLVELHLFLVALGLLNDTLTHKYGIVLVRIADARLPVLRIAEPFHAVPVQRLDVFLLDIGAKHGQFLRREVLRLEVAVSVRLVGPGLALREVGLVDRAVQFIGHVELSGQLKNGLVEAVLSKAVFLHVELDGRTPALATEVRHAPDFSEFLGLALIQTGRRGLLVPYLELLSLHAYTVSSLWEHPQDDIEALARGIINLLY